MGRKKRKTADAPESEVVPPPLMDLPIPPAIPRKQPIPQAPAIIKDEPVKEEEKEDPKKEEASSSYSMKAHGAEIIDEDIYVSDGSEDEEEQEIEMLLVGSRLGVMRKGIHHQMLVQPNRQWTRKTEQTESEEKDDEEAEQKRLKEQEEELANLDPAQRAARLLVEKQRKLEEAKENARRLESEENAGRDPCLFSKRTAFDIRFDQIDDKPWTRGDPTDYFNYGLLEEDWLEYAQQQLMIRQELTDASRQRRAADPTLVPVTPRMPSKQQPKVAVAPTGTNKLEDDEDGEGDDSDAVVGPVLVKLEAEPKEESTGPTKPPPEVKDIPVGVGGAWGAGAAPGSVLAKLIEEQEKKLAEAGDDNESYMDTSQDGSNSMMSPHKSSRYSSHSNNDSWQEPPPSHSMPPPPPPQSENRWQQQHPTDNSDNNSYYGNNSVNSGNDWSNSGRGGGYQQQQSHYQQPPPPPQQPQQRFDPRAGRGYMGRGGDRGGRSYMGGRGGRGGGRGYYNDSGGGGRGRGGGGGHYGGGGGDDGGYHRKRPRDSYDDHGGSRGGGGGWRR